jgi:Sec-independent protein translocase protein TatA
MIMAVAVLVIGPSELPVMMRALGQIVRRLQYVRYAFSQQFEDFMQTQAIDELRESVNFEAKKNLRDFDEAEEDSALDVLPALSDEGKLNNE